MAQLVDGRAAAFAMEFEEVFYAPSCNNQDILDLDDKDALFTWNFFAALTIQNACSFDRRVVQPVMGFPSRILVMGKVRFDLPCQSRKETAEDLLAANAESLDISSRKILHAFRQDITQAAQDGRIGVTFYITLQALRRLWKCDVRENERLNKMLKLFGDRAPNSSLVLVSSRISLKYQLGSTVAAAAEKQTSKRWSVMKPLTELAFEKILDHWDDSFDVMSDEYRFAGISDIPSWCPSGKDVHEWEQVLGGKFQPNQAKTNFHIVAAAASRKLYQFWTTSTKATCSFPQSRFSAMACVKKVLRHDRPVKLEENAEVFILGEIVNRSVRILMGKKEQHRLVLKRPWHFVWAADYFLERAVAVKEAITIIAFPLFWRPIKTEVNSGSSRETNIEGYFPGTADGQTPFITITKWQEAS